MKKTIALLVTTLLLFGLVGCGGASSGGASSGGDSKASAAATEAKTDGEKTGAKKWVIATDTTFKPFEYTDESGNFVGIDVDILAAVAKDQGFEYELQPLGWDASIAACQAGQADGMIAGASITEERKSSGWIFSDGYYDANQSMAVATDSPIQGFADMAGKEVAVKTGTMSASYAEELSKEHDFTVTYFEDSATMYQAVVGGQVDACFDDTPIMASYIKDNDVTMRIVDGTGNDPASYGFAIFNADNQQLVDMFNAGLKKIKSDGTYDTILERYLGE
ncbi:MAG: transporter substrate-binding domain-containing protein [Lachnospiraceae bacterium]|nr:transporter substrate-binding domain-containing protein [Lachnospiraceae bacterium]